MTLHEKGVKAIDEYLNDYPSEKGVRKNRKEVYDIMHRYCAEILFEKNNVPPTDICWNVVNNKPGTKIYDDFENWPHALLKTDNFFELVGTNYLYTGTVFHSGQKEVFGEWNSGVFKRNAFEEKSALKNEEDIKLRLLNLYDGIVHELSNVQVNVSIVDNTIMMGFEEIHICGVAVEKETYKMFDVSHEWSNQTTYLCNQEKDGTWYYYLETIEECIGEAKRIVLFENKNSLSKEDTLKTFFDYKEAFTNLFKNTNLQIISGERKGRRYLAAKRQTQRLFEVWDMGDGYVSAYLRASVYEANKAYIESFDLEFKETYTMQYRIYKCTYEEAMELYRICLERTV